MLRVLHDHSPGGKHPGCRTFLNRLDQAHVSYKLGHTRPDSVMIDISLPGWRWEAEFMADGSTGIERYRSRGVENDPGLLEELFADSDRF